MQVKVVEVGDKSQVLLVPLTSRILEVLGWKDGDEVVIDFPMTHNSLLIYKREVGR